MPIDNWFILALIMIFSSFLLCGLLPMVIRLIIARRRYRRYRIELQQIACSTPDAVINLQLIYHSIQMNTDDNLNFHEHSVLYSQIPFIDDLSKDDTSV
ncbi:unnamed protein product [Adineta steineri]|uniref:Uncharacterized protein n=1 Tax=Adineta steineri TaxID=433720 RepID=A0A814HE94_9BILA|nr:unnamed protein product [Adineta steineri]CAF1258258.1 unnamed protein product [Adineta steineri]CAF1360349.1 unnamed protein product [Adineta steineri]